LAADREAADEAEADAAAAAAVNVTAGREGAAKSAGGVEVELAMLMLICCFVVNET